MYSIYMSEVSETTLTEVEQLLKARFDPKAPPARTPSTAGKAEASERLSELMLPDNARPRMPFTKSKYIVKENAVLVTWEREVRKFLRELSPRHEHRVSAAMIFEWATGISTVELKEAGGGTSDLRVITKILKFYFGKPYMTYICGRKVPNCFKVKQGYYITRHRPMTLTLYAEYMEGTLKP